jgi:acetoin utilization protein AcuB
MDVSRYMSRNPVTVGPHDSLRTVQLLMRQGRFHHLPVMEDSRLIGIITDRDVWKRAPSGVMDGNDPSSTDLLDHLRVMGVMTLEPVTVSATLRMIDAAQLMRTKSVGALLIVERGALIGILTKSDVIDALIDSWDARR